MDINQIPRHHTETSYGKVIFVCLLFVLSLISFVSQTELTSYLYSQGYNEPFILLYLTHGSWWVIWPLQVSMIAVYKSLAKLSKSRKLEEGDYLIQSNRRHRKATFTRGFKSSFINQHRNIFKTAEIIYELNDQDYVIESEVSIKHLKQFLHSPSIKYVLKTSLWIMIILNVLGSSWYFALTLTTSSDVTLIYNCSAFTAYAFAIVFLGETFSLLKLSSVVFAIIGVIVVTYSGSSSSQDVATNRFWGNLIILIGAVLYGLYEVFYKKFLCPPSNTVSSRRQALFSSFTMSMIGVMTALVLWIPLVLVHVSGLHHFQFPPDFKLWCITIGSVLSNIVFSISFLSLISLTSPVLSSVASLVTILFVGLTEWYIFHIGLSAAQVFGDLMIAVGFVVLTIASWNEVSEEDTEEDEDDASNITDLESVPSHNGELD